MSGFAVGPPNFIGPLTPEFLESTKPGDTPALSSSLMVYNFLTGPSRTAGTLTFGYVDVRDVARALVAGLKPKVPGNHRLLLASHPWFDNTEILAHIAAIRPDLKDRLIKCESSDLKGFIADEEIVRTVEVLGLGELIPWKKTVEDSLESMLEMERVWKEKGVDVDDVLGKNPTLFYWDVHRKTWETVPCDGDSRNPGL
jgi:nucleoside-diphosphate-sugar epimerase